MRFESLLWTVLAIFLIGGVGWDGDSLVGGVRGGGESLDGGSQIPPPPPTGP